MIAQDSYTTINNGDEKITFSGNISVTIDKDDISDITVTRSWERTKTGEIIEFFSLLGFIAGINLLTLQESIGLVVVTGSIVSLILSLVIIYIDNKDQNLIDIRSQNNSYKFVVPNECATMLYEKK